MSGQRNISGPTQTRAQDDWHISALSSDRGPPSPPQASNLPQGTSNSTATKYDDEGRAASFSANRSSSSSSSPIKSYSDSGCTGREDELLMMMYPYPSLPTPLTPPSATIVFGESGKPIIRVKNIHQQEEDVFESEILPALSSSSSSSITKSVRRSGVMM